jgi:hypothetical protein
VSSDSGATEDVAHLDWCLHVGPLLVAIVVSLSGSGILRTQVIFQLAAGSSSPVFTTSGMSFEDVKPIDGRYGYVTISSYFDFPWSEYVPLLKDLLDCTLVRRRGRNSYPDLLQCQVRNELPGACPIPQIIFGGVLTCCDLGQGLGLCQLGEHQSGSRDLMKDCILLISCP